MHSSPAQKNIGVFFGSRNTEHDVSIITGTFIISGLRKLGYRVTPVYIGKDGAWYVGEKLGSLAFFAKRGYETRLAPFAGYALDLDASHGKLRLVKPGLFSKRIDIDLAFPAIHGAHGEDGALQGMFEMLNVPYAGCGVAASAIAMDKALTKELYERNGIPTTPFLAILKSEWREKESVLGTIEGKLPFPVFVKPARGGSSIGIAKASNREELSFALEVAFRYGEKAIVEAAVSPLADITCAVLGNREPVPSLLQESVFEGTHFDYAAKYLDEGGAQLGRAKKGIVIPARLDPETARKIQELAVRAFRVCGCAGIARVDFLYDTAKKEIFVNEINTLPGTLYHHLWKESGVSFSELLSRLIACAEEVHAEKNDATLTFESNILESAGSLKMKGGRAN